MCSYVFVLITVWVECGWFWFINNNNYADTTILKVAVTHRSKQDFRGQILSVFLNFRSKFKNPPLDGKKTKNVYHAFDGFSATYQRIISMVSHSSTKLLEFTIRQFLLMIYIVKSGHFNCGLGPATRPLSMLPKFHPWKCIKFTTKAYFHFATVNLKTDRSVFRTRYILAVKTSWSIIISFPVIISLNKPELGKELKYFLPSHFMRNRVKRFPAPFDILY